jgi:hypothetical protein
VGPADCHCLLLLVLLPKVPSCCPILEPARCWLFAAKPKLL